ncbi:hypothetical protein LB505_010064 [Fusarium chuoi]|nr:hypothetical protein LB505_010064 [Fusarium chuoi]
MRVSSRALTICPLIHRAEVVKNLKFRPCGVFGLVTDSGTVVSAFGAGQLKIYTSPQRSSYSFRYPTLITILFYCPVKLAIYYVKQNDLRFVLGISY